MAASGDLEEIEKVNANCILMANLQQTSTSGPQTNKAPVYDSDGLDEVHEYENCYNNEIFNMFTQEEQYIELLEPTPEPHQVQQNDSIVIFAVSSVQQGGGTVEQHPETVEETQVAKFVRDFKSLAKENDESFAKHKALELEIECLLRAVVSQSIMSIVQSNSGVETLNLQTELERTKERFENYIIKKENEYDKLWNDWYKKCEECKYDKILYDKAYNDVQQKIERLQAQLEDQKAQIIDKVSEQKNTIKDTSVDTKFSKQSILGKPPSSSGPKLHSVTPLPKFKVIPKVGESNALSKLVNSNSAPPSQKSTVVNNERVIAPRIFRINPFKASRYVNGMKSRKKNQSANVSKSANQKKHKANFKKSKKSGSKESLASPKKHRSFLRWLPTGRIFDLYGKITSSSNTKSESDTSVCDNAKARLMYLFASYLLSSSRSGLSSKGHLDALVTRTASAAAKPCQGDSFELYLITGQVDGVSTMFQLSCSQGHILILKIQGYI
ncbi:hypothetical protein Tco_0648674 [Tanacetum coccineum]